MTRVGEEFVTDPAGLDLRLAECEEPVTVFGQMDLLPGEEIARSVGERIAVVREEVVRPEAAAVAAQGERRFAVSGGDDVAILHPIYVRKSYAEEKFDLDLGLR